MRWWVESTVDRELVPAGSLPVSFAEIPPTDREWLSRFTSRSPLLHLDQRVDATAGFWNAGILVDHAPHSQFDTLVESARTAAELPATLACLALGGSGFHGNRQRAWTALPGNLHFSSYCRITLDAAECGPGLSMVPTVAVTDVLQALAGSFRFPVPWIKWVNDVFLNDAKVSGSLVSSQLDGDHITSFVLGIGLNVGLAPALGTEALFGSATSLREQGCEVSLSIVFHELLRALAVRILQLQTAAGRELIHADYGARLGGVGELVELVAESTGLEVGGTVIARGRLLAVHSDLSVEIEGSGERHRTGRLRILRPAR